ncbi:hypothetical protein [Pseudophaeobacter sp.]|uniref:hypothetical protein n=1 Tax=Pseudophaeobacter sp. TaxID=1971739 RepID=UPI002618C05B|nr:hypothetical protein [Pseudophaeobacter sp.]
MLIDACFRFISWLGRSFPEIKQQLIEDSQYESYGQLVRATPTLFWGDVGYRDYEHLVDKSASGESILDRIIAIVKESPPAVQNEILVGFVEAHMFPRPDSPLAKEMGEALGMDLSGLC